MAFGDHRVSDADDGRTLGDRSEEVRVVAPLCVERSADDLAGVVDARRVGEVQTEPDGMRLFRLVATPSAKTYA